MSNVTTVTGNEPDTVGKSKTICFRVSAEEKERIEDAARRKGQSVTTFLQKAAEAAVRKVEAMPATKPRQFGGVPTYFRACCWEASQGGATGYKRPAYELARHLAHEQPYEMGDDEWSAELQELADLLMPEAPDRPTTPGGLSMIAYELRDDEAVWAWFEEHYPRCMKLIPRRRRKQFVEGVYECADNDDIGLDL